ncbi:MAG: alpha/beta hydrolase-fold protein [Pseudoxanthomonas sp.]
MRSVPLQALALLGLLLPAAGRAEVASTTTTTPRFAVSLPTGTAPASGRLLIFASEAGAARAAAKDGQVDAVDANPFRGTRTAVAAREVDRIEAGTVVPVDGDEQAWPAFSTLPAGDYLVQAVLDVDHSYAYSGRGAGDLVGPVTRVHLPAAGAIALALGPALASRDPWDLPAGRFGPAVEKSLAQAKAHCRPLAFASPALTAFWGRPVTMRGWVLLPPGYADGKQRYPTVYFTHGFGANADSLTGYAASVYAAMADGRMPAMIWVFLDQSSPTGTHEFADSVNNGPWGRALTTELIPALESRYRMDARPSGRFLNGHSSGGWATLWLQVRYPKVFGGTWSTAPDPSDFHDFTGVDLYAPGANVYRRADGTPYPLVRDHARVLGTFEDFARLERVLGAYGGQMASFEWVFSPRGADGRPLPMFDRDTGAVDPQVAAYWREHYDIAARLQRHWPALKPDLDGKIHLIVGSADTFYLDGAAHRLKAVLDGLGAHAEVRFVPERTHFDLYQIGEDRQGLLSEIAWAMYALARPGSQRPQAAPASGG